MRPHFAVDCPSVWPHLFWFLTHLYGLTPEEEGRAVYRASARRLNGKNQLNVLILLHYSYSYNYSSPQARHPRYCCIQQSSRQRTAKRSRNDSRRREDDDTDEPRSSGEQSSVRRTAKRSKDQKFVKKNENVLHSSINVKRTRWSAEHLALLKNSFMHMKKPPNAMLIKKLLTNEPSLRSRTIPQIKSRAWALINSKMAGTK